MEEVFELRIEETTLECVFRALGDPARFEMVSKMLAQGEVSCKMLCGDAPKSSVSHHFRILRECGLTHTRLCGNQRWMSIRENELEMRFPGLLELIRNEAGVARSRGLEPPTLSSAS
jgi:DNA-binding transcriptional ArsR family regulator